MFLKTLEICVLKDINLKNTKVKLELITNYDMVMMVEYGIRGGICQVPHKYAKANNKYMKNYDKNIESSYLAF